MAHVVDVDRALNLDRPAGLIAGRAVVAANDEFGVTIHHEVGVVAREDELSLRLGEPHLLDDVLDDVVVEIVLLGRMGFPAESDLFVRLLVPPSGSPRIDRIVAFPATTSESGVERHDFTACGMSFTLYAGGEVPGALYKFSFPQKRMVLLSDGRALLESVAREVTASPAAGSLAERH